MNRLPNLYIGFLQIGVKRHQKVTRGHLVKITEIYGTSLNDRYSLMEQATVS